MAAPMQAAAAHTRHKETLPRPIAATRPNHARTRRSQALAVLILRPAGLTQLPAELILLPAAAMAAVVPRMLAGAEALPTAEAAELHMVAVAAVLTAIAKDKHVWQKPAAVEYGGLFAFQDLAQPTN
jgi:hypothetical protein